MKQKKNTVFFSNKLEVLASNLHKELFSSSTSVFEPRTIVVPDAELKTYLHHRFAKDPLLQISMGIEVISLSQAVHHMLRQSVIGCSFYFPTTVDLAFKIEEEILFLIEQKEFFPDLWGYLQGNGCKTALQQKKKATALADELSRVFSTYSLYDKAIIDKWHEHKGWKQYLWDKIFSGALGWSCPAQVMQETPYASGRVHLFGFSFLPKCYFTFFNRFESTYYFLSPCQHFWEDVYSDKERIHLQKVLEGKKVKLAVRKQLDFYLKDTNPLLSNFGKVGREFVKMMAKEELLLEESYDDQKSQNPSLLEHLQEDLLFLHSKEDTADILLKEEDRSIRCLSCSSPLREIEVLLETIYELIDESQATSDPIAPSDILVLSSSLDRYVPYIQAIFGSSSPFIDYTIKDVQSTMQKDEIDALHHLLSIPEKRFSLEAVLKLFSFPSFQKRRRWKPKDVGLISKWLEDAKVKWGFDGEQKAGYLSSFDRHDLSSSGGGSWIEGLERLTLGLAMIIPEGKALEQLQYPWPLQEVEWTEAELLSDVIDVIESLAHDLKVIEQQCEQTLSQWLCYLKEMMERYFESEEENALNLQLHKIQASYASKLKAHYSYASLARLLEFVLQNRKHSLRSSHLEAVRFLPLKEGKITPAKVVYLLGMEEESFPRSESTLALSDVSKMIKMEYIPSQSEKDRYLLLQAILSARKHLFFSFTRISSEDHKPQALSPFVQEIFSYLDQYYSSKEALSTKLMFVHPSLSFHKRYFDGTSQLRLYSQAHKRAAKEFYSDTKVDRSTLFPEFYHPMIAARKVEDNEEAVNIEKLSRFAKHPIRYYLREVLGIYLESLFEEEKGDFTLAGYDKSKLRALAWNDRWRSEWSQLEAKGSLPQGLFKELAIRTVTEETSQIVENLQCLISSKERVFSLRFSRECKRKIKKEKEWIYPALQISTPMGRRYVIEGILPHISLRGMVVFAEGNSKDLMETWPSYLVYRCLAAEDHELHPDLLFVKKEEKLLFEKLNEEHMLGLYLDYFAESQDIASFLMPSWASSILYGGPDQFEKKIAQEEHLAVEPFADDYLRWVFLRDKAPDAVALYDTKIQKWKEVFAPLLEKMGGK